MAISAFKSVCGVGIDAPRLFPAGLAALAYLGVVSCRTTAAAPREEILARFEESWTLVPRARASM